MRRAWLPLLLSCLLSAGCLLPTHRVSRGELARLANTPPERRGDAVRVVQDLSGTQPPAAEPVSDDTALVLGPDVYVDAGQPVRVVRPEPPRSGSGGGGGKAPVRGGKGLGAGKADDAWVLVAVAASFAVVLAATEGARYDGWVRLHPMHPVHLFGPGGHAVVPLAQLGPTHVAWAERAVVLPSEGPWRPLGRAPLDRTGWTYSVLGGLGESISADASRGLGGTARVQVGFFPLHQLGVQAEWAFATRDNALGQTLFDNRVGLEATFAPLDAGRLHAGVFGGVGLASRFDDGFADGRRDDTAVTGGALVQLGVTTRLALTARLGLAWAYGEQTRDVALGLSIY